VSAELFKINIGHVLYRGGAPALTDLLAGQVQLYFSPTPAAIEYIRAGKLRALAHRPLARPACRAGLGKCGAMTRHSASVIPSNGTLARRCIATGSPTQNLPRADCVLKS
jgi:hypothetical protein